jgi:hypothetical protein
LILWVPLATAEDPAPPATDPDLIARIVAEEQETERRRVGVTRFRASNSQTLSSSIGFLWTRQPISYSCVSTCKFKGPLLQLEPGIGGGQVSVGYATLIATGPRNERFLSDVYLGLGIKGALLRTWSDTASEPADRTFAGIEGEFTITRFNFSLGMLYDLSDHGPGDGWRTTFGMGWGF